MKLEVLISAMHLRDFSIVEKSNVKSDVLIINQTNHDGYDECVINGHRARMISTTQRGLSCSRNMALIHANGDICLIADDDEVFDDDYENTILKAFERLSDATIIAFNVKCSSKSRDINSNSIGKERRTLFYKTYPSVALAFRRENIIKFKVYFDVRLGAGSGVISAGEETEWQFYAQNKGLKRYECPGVISTLRLSTSQWFKGYNQRFFYDIGANLAINYPCLKHILKFYYLWRLRNECELSFCKKIQCMNMGMKGFRQGCSYVDFINSKHP